MISGLLDQYNGRRAEQNGQQEVKSIDSCRPDLARPFVAADTLAALCMPCSVLIYTDDTGTKLAAMQPSVIMPRSFRTPPERSAISPRVSITNYCRSSKQPKMNEIIHTIGPVFISASKLWGGRFAAEHLGEAQGAGGAGDAGQDQG